MFCRNNTWGNNWFWFIERLVFFNKLSLDRAWKNCVRSKFFEPFVQIFCLLQCHSTLYYILVDHRKIMYNSSFFSYFIRSVFPLVIKSRLSCCNSKRVFVVSRLLQKRYLLWTDLSLFDIGSGTRRLSSIQRDTCQCIPQHWTFEDTQTFKIPNLTYLVLRLEVYLTADCWWYLLCFLRIVLVRGRARNRRWVFIRTSTYISKNHAISFCATTESGLSNSWHYVVWICIFFVGSRTRWSLPCFFESYLCRSQACCNLVADVFWQIR